jgi:hypothetical protein
MLKRVAAKRHKMSTSIFCVILCFFVAACHSAKVETATAPKPVAAPSAEPTYKPGPQPTEAEVREVIVRNYKDAVVIDNTQSTPFLTGDFNGDDSEDVAVVVKPGKGKLPELNSEYSNWILEDPHQRPPEKQNVRPRPISVQGNDVLLAVIHGHERDGWRNALATQTYLLRNAVGREFVTQRAGQLDDKTVPRLRGDVIREKLDGTEGIIYWTGAKYAWHPVS